MSTAAQQSPPDHPALSHHPAPAPGSEAEGKIKLDVVVTDDAGRPVAGLEEKDFTLLDNEKPRPILSFHGVDGTVGAGRREPPVEVVLLVDVANTDLRVVGNERYQIESFLRRDGGRLAQPTSLMVFDDRGVKGLPQPTKDGNRLADELNKAESTTTHSILLTTQTEPIRMTLSLNALQRIIEAENQKAGRKILIWIGDGWPMLENSYYLFTERDHRPWFDGVVTSSGDLREARVTLYSIYPTDPATTDEPHVQHYRSFLKGVPSVHQVRPGNLALPVLAIHSGGRALDAPGNLGDQIASCIAEAKFYYTLTFDPATAKHVDEYHELAVRVDQPRLKARTSAGYYGEPVLQFQPPALGAH
ncbi:MAG TPA: VWA domain-containing protein [Acidobacteriaceae bacterium]|nr:VWA domain-containing protein [Acidobacteriaceae bacterium]